MGFLNKVFGIEKRSDGVLEAGAELLRAIVGNGEITAEKALEIPAFSAAVDFICNTISMLPVKLYRENLSDNSTEEITEDKRLFFLNDEANSVMGADAAKRAALRDMLIYGSGFLYIDQNVRGDISGLYYVKKSDVSVMKNADPIFRDFNLFVGSRGYLPWNFVILTRNSEDGVTGAGAVEEHKTLLSAMYFMMKLELVLSKTGGNKKGFLESEHKLSKEAMTELKRLWNELYANNESNMMILNNGLKYVPSASSSVEMQLNENKQTNSEQIAQIFGLSPAVLSGSCSTQEYMSAIRTAVLPIAAQFQAALNRSLLREDEKGEMYFALDISELLKGDTLSRYQAYEIALRNGFLQLDEVRYLEDKKPLGFDFMKLDLSDVLYDYKTKTVYTPNMNALTKLGENSLTNDEIRAIMEYRKKTNWIKGAHGYFAGSYPEGGGGSGGNSGLTNGNGSSIINIERGIEKMQTETVGEHFASGNRRSPFYVLNAKEIEEIKQEIRAINADEKDFVFNSDTTKGTCFLASDGKVHIKGNIFPDEYSDHPRDKMSVRAVLAHEYYGHKPYRQQYLREDSATSSDALNKIFANAWADEFRASYMAAKNAPNLSDNDRRLLVMDSLTRAQEAGVSIRYNDFIRRVLYG